MHACNYVTNYTVTWALSRNFVLPSFLLSFPVCRWCPDGTMPPQPAIQCNEIHPVGSQSLCVSIAGNTPQFGTPVQLYIHLFSLSLLVFYLPLIDPIVTAHLVNVGSFPAVVPKLKYQEQIFVWMPEVSMGLAYLPNQRSMSFNAFVQI